VVTEDSERTIGSTKKRRVKEKNKKERRMKRRETK
jgi:hypothetical protein